MYCDNCGRSSLGLNIVKNVDGENHCDHCTPYISRVAIAEAAYAIRHQLNKEQLDKLDKAFGVIHELLPDYYRISSMGTMQGINTETLSAAAK